MTQALVATAAPIVGIAMMDEKEARAYVAMMRDDIDTADQSLKNFRARAFDFAEREGWRALGYAGVIPAIQAELGEQYSKSYISRILTAGAIEQVLELPIGQLPERTLRPLAELDTVEQQRAAWSRMNELTAGKPTAKAAELAVQEIKPAEPDFDAAHQRAVAIGYKLSKYGGWWRLSSKGDEHPAAPPAAVLESLSILEGEAAKKAQKPTGWVCKKCKKAGVRELYSDLCLSCYQEQQVVVSTPEPQEKPFWAMTSETAPGHYWQRNGANTAYISLCGRKTQVKPAFKFMTRQCEKCLASVIAEEDKQRVDALVLADLDALLPTELERAGYYWKSAEPPTIVHNDGWSADAPTAESALLMATTHLRKRKEESDKPITVFPALNQEECRMLMREAKDFIERGIGTNYPTIAKAIRIAARMALEVSE